MTRHTPSEKSPARKNPDMFGLDVATLQAAASRSRKGACQRRSSSRWED